MYNFKDWKIDEKTGVFTHMGSADEKVHILNSNVDLAEEYGTESSYKKYIDEFAKQLNGKLSSNVMEDLYGKPNIKNNFFKNLPNKDGDIFPKESINNGGGVVLSKSDLDNATWVVSGNVIKNEYTSNKIKKIYKYNEDNFKTEYGCMWFDGNEDSSFVKEKGGITLPRAKLLAKRRIKEYKDTRNKKSMIIGAIKK